MKQKQLQRGATSMNYEHRIAIVRRWFKEQIAPRFSIPPGLDPKMTAQDICETVNRSIPSNLSDEQINHILGTTTAALVSAAKTRTVPIPSVFQQATSKGVSALLKAGAANTTNDGPDLDPLSINARRIKRGDAVSEYYITGGGRSELVTRGLVTQEELVHYDIYVERHLKKDVDNGGDEDVSF